MNADRYLPALPFVDVWPVRHRDGSQGWALRDAYGIIVTYHAGAIGEAKNARDVAEQVAREVAALVKASGA